MTSHGIWRGGIRGPLTCRYQTPNGPVVKRGTAAVLHPPIVRTSTATALVVGTILNGINHGGALLRGQWPVAQIVLTYCVPYVVATYGAVMASRIPWMGVDETPRAVRPPTTEEAEASSSGGVRD